MADMEGGFFDFVKIKTCKEGSDVVNVFVHGYMAVARKKDEIALNSQISKYDGPGDCYVAVWNSGKLRDYLGEFSAIALLTSRFSLFVVKNIYSAINHYLECKRMADAAGKSLQGEIVNKLGAGLCGKSVNLIGHSLGGRVVLTSLISSDVCVELEVADVLAMGAAIEISVHDVSVITNRISGRFYNLYSESDKVLVLEPSLEKCAGRRKIPHQSVRNIELDIGHTEYWPNLRRVTSFMHVREVIRYTPQSKSSKVFAKDDFLFRVLKECEDVFLKMLSRVISTKLSSSVKADNTDPAAVGIELKLMGGDTFANAFRYLFNSNDILYSEIVKDVYSWLEIKSGEIEEGTREKEKAVFDEIRSVLQGIRSHDRECVEDTDFQLFEDHFSLKKYENTVAVLYDHFSGFTVDFSGEAYSVTVPAVAIIYLARKYTFF